MTLVAFVFALVLFYLAPVPILFASALAFAASGPLLRPVGWLRERLARRPA